MRLLLRRHGDGIGDWLFMLQAMKHLNLAAPSVRFDVSFELEPRHNRRRAVPAIVVEAYNASDVDWTPLAHDTAPDAEIPHVVYPFHGTGPYVEGMLAQMAAAAELAMCPAFDPTIVPEYDAGPATAPAQYVGLVSQSKKETAWKNWGIERFERLGQRVFRELRTGVLQIGASGDYELAGIPYHRALGCNFATLVYWLKRCHLVVTLENGIAVLCGHLGIPHIVIHMTDRTEQRLVSSTGKPLRRPSVDEVFEVVKEMLL